jgi:glycine cleavage system H protein
MSNIPEELKYTAEHEWIRDEGEGIVCVGITDHAQEQLGDLVFVELPEPGEALTRGAECAVVESVKAASDVFSPLSGEVVESNEALVDTPELINQDPYGDGWVLKMRVAEPSELADLLGAAAYAEIVAVETP